MNTKQVKLLLLLTLSGTLVIQNPIYANISSTYEYEEKEIDVRIGMASWYSEQSPGINKHTANMEIFDDSGLTAAMWEVPFNQRIKVTNLENGKSVIVRVNDRGPHRRFVREGRIIDLSKRAFATIASLDKGLIDIELEIL